MNCAIILKVMQVGTSILVVEDESIVALEIQEKLSALGYTVFGPVSSGEAALSLLQSHKPSLVLMDIRLSGELDGVETAEIIRERYNIPLIFLTAYSTWNIIERAKAAIPYGYLTKPFNNRDLQIAIEMALHRHKAELSALESERRYRRMMETANDAVLLIDASSGEIVDCNDVAVSLLKTLRSQLLGSRLEQHCPVKENPWLRDMMNVETVREFPFLSECMVASSAGGNFWADVSFNAFETAEETFIQIFLRDVSERKLAEQALQESEEKYRMLFDRSPLPVFVVDRSTLVFLAVNETATRRLGYPAGAFSDMTLFDIVEHHGSMKAFMHRLESRSGGDDVSLVTADSSRIDVELTSYAITFEGRPSWLIQVVDVTERKRSELHQQQRQEAIQSLYRLATSLERDFKSICEQAVLSLVRLLNARHVFVIKFNAAGLDVIAHARGDQLMSETTGPIPREQSNGIISCKEVVYSSGELDTSAHCLPFVAHYAPGTVLCVPIKDARGARLGRVSAFFDGVCQIPTDTVNLMEVFGRHLGYELERSELEHSLRDAQRMEVIGKLTGGVAHEVRNPLNAIMALTDALAADLGDNEEYAVFLSHMRTQVERLSTLMRDLLDLGKPVSHLTFEPQCMRAVCRAAVDLWQHSRYAVTHPVALSLPAGTDEIPVMGDTKRLQQVLLNLLDNAAQHSPEGSIQLNLTCESNKEVTISVVDSGSGMDEETLRRVFEPFYSTRRGGTGLGLSIVHHFIEAHRGSIVLRNNPGAAGCNATITLPLLTEEQMHDNAFNGSVS